MWQAVFFVPLAQMAELPTFNRAAVGSNPTGNITAWNISGGKGHGKPTPYWYDCNRKKHHPAPEEGWAERKRAAGGFWFCNASGHIQVAKRYVPADGRQSTDSICSSGGISGWADNYLQLTSRYILLTRSPGLTGYDTNLSRWRCWVRAPRGSYGSLIYW